MQLEQRQTLSQKLVLTQTMRQSLDCLQLSAPELAEYVQEVALSNPLLDVQSPTYYETELPSETAPAEREPLEVRESPNFLMKERSWSSCCVSRTAKRSSALNSPTT